ncbi:MAG TPA: cation diffusion facilitator family transporter [Bryobacteraceae bacterium]|nr:cation diffusion facilitator family transporter [Bryobacteraceae bacterium]
MPDLNRLGRRVAIASMAASAALALLKITVGMKAGSTAVVSDGIESAADVFSSGIVLVGLIIASKPADSEHPYGHGRFEILSALGIGLMLFGTGTLICFQSIAIMREPGGPPKAYAIWPLLISIFVKSALWGMKRRWGKKMHSEVLLADAANDWVDILSGLLALAGISLTLLNPAGFPAADHIGGFAVGVVVIALGLRVVHDTALQLMDTMPDENSMRQIREAALSVPGALGIEKCYARKTGQRYHVDLHLEVDPELSVRRSHDIATEVRAAVTEQLDWVADVLVHVEPFAPATIAKGARASERSDGKS